MNYKFICYGHENILATHKRTLEITSDNELSLNGDCIIGIKANFDPEKIKPFLNSKRLKLTLNVDNLEEEILFKPNPSFFDSKELVIRISDFISNRTLGINADKAAIHLNRRMIKFMENPLQEMKVSLSED